MSDLLLLELVISKLMLESRADILALLAETSPEDCRLSKTQVKKAMQQGALWLQQSNNKIQRLRRMSRTLLVGDHLYLYYDQKVLEQQTKPALLIADEGTYSVWYKPYGMYAQGSKWGDHCTVHRWAEQHLEPQRPAYIVHRLDRATSGLIILAHQKRSAAALCAMFERHELKKEYHALVHGEFPDTAQAVTINNEIDGRQACSHVSLIEVSPCRQYSLVLVTIDTGRKHQIRRHLSEISYPIVGDRLYGRTDESEGKDLQLVATHLAFICPIQNTRKDFILPLELQQKLY